MSIKIGDNNRIKNTTIAENSSLQNASEKNNWIQKHPIISGLVVAIIAGAVMMLKFWEPVINFLNNLIGG